MVLWIALLAATGIVTAIQLIALHRQRRLFLLDPQRRRFFLSHVQQQPRQARAAHQRPVVAAATPPLPAPAANGAAVVGAADAQRTEAAASTASARDEAVVYVDASGECTFANRAARELLHWNAGTLALRDVLAGGRSESDALMESLARRGLVEKHPSTLAGPTHTPLEISAVAVRDRDDNLWGAAFFIRPGAGVSTSVGHCWQVSPQH